MVGIPRPGREVLTESVDDPLLDPRLKKRPYRLRGADLRVEQRLGRSLSPHRRARLDRQHPAIPGLIGARTGTRIDHGTSVAQRPLDPLRDPWIRPPKPRVGTPVLLIVHPQGHHESLDTRATTSAGRPPAER